MAGSRGILKIQGSDQSFVVARDWLFVFFQARDVSSYSIFRHLASFFDGTPIGDAAGQCWNGRSETAFRLRSENDVIAISGFCHYGAILSGLSR